MSIAHQIPEHATTPYSGRQVCVTGGAGFIGGHIAEALLTAGAQVNIIDDLSTGSSELITWLIHTFGDQVNFIDGSILDPGSVDEALEDCSVVFHQAALASVPRSINFPRRTHLVNDLGTVDILEGMKRQGTKRIVFASSSSVYGDTPDMPKHEGMTLEPLSPYAASKAASELSIRAWTSSYDIDGISLRYFNVFGSRQSPASDYAAVIPAFANALSQGNQPTVFGDGRQSRDFTHVANVVCANLLAGSTPKRLGGHAVNIGTGTRLSIIDLLDKLKVILDRRDIAPRIEPTRPGDVAHSLAAIEEAKRSIGYEPIMSTDDGLRETLVWLTGPSVAGKLP